MSRWCYWLSIVGCTSLSAYCFLWAVQTAWLGSFPGRDIHVYSVRFYWQLFGALVFLIVAVAFGVRFHRRLPDSSARNDG